LTLRRLALAVLLSIGASAWPSQRAIFRRCRSGSHDRRGDGGDRARAGRLAHRRQAGQPTSTGVLPRGIRRRRQRRLRRRTDKWLDHDGHAPGVQENDLLRVYFVTKRDGVGYNLAYIGKD
jgi:hypothetical protein